MFRKNFDNFKFDLGDFYRQVHRERYLDLLSTLSKARGDVDVLLVGGSMLRIEPKTTELLSALEATTNRYEASKKAKYEDAGKPRPETRTDLEAAALQARRDILSGKGVESRGKANYLGHNEAFIFYNGRKVKQVFKAMNASDFPWGGGPERSLPLHVDMVFGLGGGTTTMTPPAFTIAWRSLTATNLSPWHRQRRFR